MNVKSLSKLDIAYLDSDYIWYSVFDTFSQTEYIWYIELGRILRCVTTLVSSTAPVSCHEDQGVDGDVGGDIDDVLHSAAPGEAEGPVHEDVVTGGGGHTHQQEQQVSHRQVQDQEVGRVLHLRVAVNLRRQMKLHIKFRAKVVQFENVTGINISAQRGSEEF